MIYTLVGSELRVDYSVRNPSASEDLFFSVGAHEAYACPEGIGEYSVLFDCPETLDSVSLVDGLLGRGTKNLGKNVRELPLRDELFADDALVFLGLRSRKVELVHRKTQRSIALDFAGHDAFLLWTKPGAKYICLEPWCGYPDTVDADRLLEHKGGIIRLTPGSGITKTHRILL